MKDLDYYSTIPVAYPNKDDFKKVFVYSKGKVIVDGVRRSDLADNALAEYRNAGCVIDDDFDKAGYTAARDAYSNAYRALEDEFKRDLFAENGMSEHPKAEKLYAIVTNERDGRNERRDLFEELAALFH